MLANVMTEYGGPEVLVPQEIASPRSEPGRVVVELRAAALNWHDVLVRRGACHSPLPHTPGADGAGICRETGEEVIILPSLDWGPDRSAPGPGWQILGDQASGTYAAQVSVPADCIAPKPRSLNWNQAASLGLTGGTAFRALYTRGRLQPNESVLILGAGGGMSTMLVMLAHGTGNPVFVTSSSREKIERAQLLGAKDGVLYTEKDWPKNARELLPSGGGFDLVIDTVGTWEGSIRTLRPGGRLVVLGSSASDHAQIDIRQFYFGQFDLLGTTMASPSDFKGLLELIGTIPNFAPQVERTWPLDQAAAAHRELEAGTHFGNIVLEV